MEWNSQKLKFDHWPDDVYLIMTFDKSKAMVLCEGRDDSLYEELVWGK